MAEESSIRVEIDDLLDVMVPKEPAEPTAPKEPVEPVEPTEPIEPESPEEPSEPEPQEPAEPEPKSPEEPVTEPSEKPKEPEEPEVPEEPAESLKETLEEAKARLEEQNRILLERIEHLSTPPEFRAPEEPKKPAESASATSAVPEPQPTTTSPVIEPVAAVVDFLKGKSIEEIQENPAEFNKVLNDVVGQAATRNVDIVVEKILTSIPNLVAGQIVQQNALNEMVKDFYDANQDLKQVKRTVAAFANEVHSEHPDWAVADIFKESGVRTRKALGLREQTTGSPSPSTTQRNPAFAKVRGARKGAEPEITGMAKEIDDLITDF